MWIYRTNELEDLIERSQDNLRKIENDIEESQGERAEKLKGLIAQEKVRKGRSCDNHMTHNVINNNNNRVCG